MTIKSKTSFYISLIFSLLFIITSVFVINRFSNFRQEEFEERLREKAINNIQLLEEVQSIDNNLVKTIDKHTIFRLFNEKTLIFDSSFNLIYSSLDDSKIDWTLDDLLYLKKHKTFFKKEKRTEIYGVLYKSGSKNYYALVSAIDEVGRKKLKYLTLLMISVGISFIMLTWLISFKIIKKQLSPLDSFTKKIKKINDLNEIKIIENKLNSNNEIDLLSVEFNFMMSRINEVYQKQKEFTTNVSHEFRTPLARISAQLENHLQNTDNQEHQFLSKIFLDINQLKELINSLLLLAKIDSKQFNLEEEIRLDECIYNSIENATKQYDSFKISFDIDYFENLENKLIIRANPQLIEIAISNLLKNAYQYADNQKAKIVIKQIDNRIAIEISNTGNTLSIEEQENLFKPFVRGKNAANYNGVGLGLRIVSRILSSYGFSITYKSYNNQNIFTILF